MNGVTITGRVDLEIRVDCKCGATLSIESAEEYRDGATITLEPCAACIESAKEEQQ